MKWHHSILRSRNLAVAITCAVVLIMLMPLRGSREGIAPRQAGWLPVLHSGGGFADSSTFHRLKHSPSRHLAGDVPLVRVPATANSQAPR